MVGRGSRSERVEVEVDLLGRRLDRLGIVDLDRILEVSLSTGL